MIGTVLLASGSIQPVITNVWFVVSPNGADGRVETLEVVGDGDGDGEDDGDGDGDGSNEIGGWLVVLSLPHPTSNDDMIARLVAERKMICTALTPLRLGKNYLAGFNPTMMECRCFAEVSPIFCPADVEWGGN